LVLDHQPCFLHSALAGGDAIPDLNAAFHHHRQRLAPATTSACVWSALYFLLHTWGRDGGAPHREGISLRHAAKRGRARGAPTNSDAVGTACLAFEFGSAHAGPLSLRAGHWNGGVAYAVISAASSAHKSWRYGYLRTTRTNIQWPASPAQPSALSLRSRTPRTLHRSSARSLRTQPRTMSSSAVALGVRLHCHRRRGGDGLTTHRDGACEPPERGRHVQCDCA
jgi:hypothetical protein